MASPSQVFEFFSKLSTLIDWAKIDKDKVQQLIREAPRVAREFVKFVENGGQAGVVKYIINLLVAPFPEEWNESDGWKIDEHDVGTGELEWDPSKVNLYLSTEQSDGKSMTGHDLRKEIKDKKIPVLNACVLEFLLAHPFLIPESWKMPGYIFFWGTIYRLSGGDLYVRCLCSRDDRWHWSHRWLGNDWIDCNLAALRAMPDGGQAS